MKNLTCEFESVLRSISKQLFTYMHLVVIEAILNSKCVNNEKAYLTAEEVCECTNLYIRDTMKLLNYLTNSHILDMTTISIGKKRVCVWGINFYSAFNFLHAKLTNLLCSLHIHENILYCQNCKETKLVEDCITRNFEMKCPCGSNQVTCREDDGRHEKDTLERLVRQIEELKHKTPLFTYSIHLNRSNTGDVLAI